MTKPNRPTADRPRPPMKARNRQAPKHRGLRTVVFGAVALVISVAALALVATRLAPPAPAAAGVVQIQASMGGFQPAAMSVKAGSAVSVELTSTDSSFHSDGGGWHEMAIDELGIDWKVGPESSKEFEFTAPSTPGTYTWFCGICCGGRANPSMQGKLTVTA